MARHQADNSTLPVTDFVDIKQPEAAALFQRFFNNLRLTFSIRITVMSWIVINNLYSEMFTASFPSTMKEHPLDVAELKTFVRTIFIEKFATNEPRMKG